jgi:hypothetical protein
MRESLDGGNPMAHGCGELSGMPTIMMHDLSGR